MKTCKTCPAWTRYEYYGTGWGRCGKGESKSGRPLCKSTLAYSFDGEEYGGCLATHETYACNQMPAKWPEGE